MEIRHAGNSKWQLVISNQALGITRVFTFNTYREAQAMAYAIQTDRGERLDSITTIGDYFKVRG